MIEEDEKKRAKTLLEEFATLRRAVENLKCAIKEAIVGQRCLNSKRKS